MFLYIATALIAVRTKRVSFVFLFAIFPELAFSYLQSMTFAGVSETFIIKIFVAIVIGSILFGYKEHLLRKSEDKFLNFKRKATFALVLSLTLISAVNAIIICMGIKERQRLFSNKSAEMTEVKKVHLPIKIETKEDNGFGIIPDPMLVNTELGQPTAAARRANDDAGHN